MSSISDLTELTGLTQSELAEYAGISRSHVAMSHIGKRSLPTSALIKLSQLWLRAMKLQLEDTSPQLHEVHALKNPARLRQQAKHLRAKASRSEYAVSELAKSIARTGLLKRLLDGMHAEQKTATDEGDRLWVNYMKAKTIKKLEKLGDAKHLQELRIRRMLDKAEMLEGLAESLKGAGGKTIVQS